VPPLMVQDASNPGGLPKDVFDDFQLRSRRGAPVLPRDRVGPFYGYNRPARSRRRRHLELVAPGMMGGAKAHYDGVVAFSQTDFTEDLKKITVPVLVMHGDDDQIVPTPTRRRCRRSCCKNGTSRPTRASRTACRPARPTPSTPICSRSWRADRRTRERLAHPCLRLGTTS
jgi:non-heme chloroperoxidase